MHKDKVVNRLFLSLLIFTIFVSCESLVSNNSSLKSIKLEFIVNDSLCVIDSSFEIIVKKLDDNILYSCKASGDSVIIPDSVWDAVDYFNVVVKYNTYLLLFDSVSSGIAKPLEKMEWKFGIEKKPFLVVGSIIHPSMTSNDPGLKEIYFWKFRPYDGHGRQIIKKIY